MSNPQTREEDASPVYNAHRVRALWTGEVINKLILIYKEHFSTIFLNILKKNWLNIVSGRRSSVGVVWFYCIYSTQIKRHFSWLCKLVLIKEHFRTVPIKNFPWNRSNSIGMLLTELCSLRRETHRCERFEPAESFLKAWVLCFKVLCLKPTYAF